MFLLEAITHKSKLYCTSPVPVCMLMLWCTNRRYFETGMLFACCFLWYWYWPQFLFLLCNKLQIIHNAGRWHQILPTIFQATPSRNPTTANQRCFDIIEMKENGALQHLCKWSALYTPLHCTFFSAKYVMYCIIKRLASRKLAVGENLQLGLLVYMKGTRFWQRRTPHFLCLYDTVQYLVFHVLYDICHISGLHTPCETLKEKVCFQM